MLAAKTAAMASRVSLLNEGSENLMLFLSVLDINYKMLSQHMIWLSIPAFWPDAEWVPRSVDIAIAGGKSL